MIETIITSSVLIIIITLIRFILKGRISSRLQYAIWGLVAIRLLLPVSFISSPVSVMNIMPQLAAYNHDRFFNAESGQVYLPSTRDNSNLPLQNAEDITGSLLPTDSGSNASDAGTYNSRNQGRPAINLMSLVQRPIPYVWAGGTAVIALYFIFLNFRFRKKLNKNASSFEVQNCRLPVYRADFLSSPCLLGFLKPKIYIAGFLTEDETVLNQIITHELCHYTHLDNWWSLLRGIILAIYWFNPFVWLAAALSRQDCELACDEAAINMLGESSRFSYGRTIISLTIKKAVPGGFFTAATTMSSGSRSLKERIKLIAKKPKMTAAIAAVVVFAAISAVLLTFTGGPNSINTAGNKGETFVSETQPGQQSENADQTQSGNTDDTDAIVNSLLNEILSSDTVTVEYDTKGSSGTSSNIRTKKLGPNDREGYKNVFFFSKGWKVISAQEAENASISNEEKISIYDDKGHRFNLAQDSYIVSYIKGDIELYYKASNYVSNDMISVFAMPTEEESRRWDEDMKKKAPGQLYVNDMEGSNYKAVGDAWAQGWLKQYMSLSKDHPCYSDNGSVANVVLIGVSTINHPRTLVFNITLSLHPANGRAGFVAYFVGNTSGEDGENELLGRQVVIENTGANQWTFKDMGTGGYNGWGYYWPLEENTDSTKAEYDEIQKSIESRKGDFTDMEWILMSLNRFNWNEYSKLYGSGAEDALMDCVEAQAFGSDQEIRTVYVLEGISGLNDEIKPRYIALLKKLEASDRTLFNRCVEESGKASAIIDIMK